MPQLGNIVINDGQATPVAHTFAPTSISGGDNVTSAALADRSVAQAIGWPKLRYKITFPDPNGRVSDEKRLIKVERWISVPTLEVLSGADSGYTPAPTVAYRHESYTRFTMPERGTSQERKNLRMYTANASLSSAEVAVVEQLETFW